MCGTHQTVIAVVQEHQEHSLFSQSKASLLACQRSFHHTFEEEWEMFGPLLEHLAHIMQKKKMD